MVSYSSTRKNSVSQVLGKQTTKNKKGYVALAILVNEREKSTKSVFRATLVWREGLVLETLNAHAAIVCSRKVARPCVVGKKW